MDLFVKAEISRLLREHDAKGGVLGELPPGLEVCPNCRGRWQKRKFESSPGGACRVCHKGFVLAEE